MTGANKGIGLEVARQLGDLGITVLIGSRDEGKGKEAAATLGGNAHAVRLDVTDEASVTAAAEWIDAEFGRLDILVNNAGITAGVYQPPSQTTLEMIRRVYETNVLGAVAVTNAMLPLLRRSDRARIVMTTSELGSKTLASDPGSPYAAANLLDYNSSKAALNMVMVSYANELRDTGILVNAGCPGYCATDLNGHSGFRTPVQGAAIAVRLATLPADGPTGGYFNDEGTLPW